MNGPILSSAVRAWLRLLIAFPEASGGFARSLDEGRRSSRSSGVMNGWKDGMARIVLTTIRKHLVYHGANGSAVVLLSTTLHNALSKLRSAARKDDR